MRPQIDQNFILCVAIYFLSNFCVERGLNRVWKGVEVPRILLAPPTYFDSEYPTPTPQENVMVLLYYLLQFFSSEPSGQSLSLSHLQYM